MKGKWGEREEELSGDREEGRKDRIKEKRKMSNERKKYREAKLSGRAPHSKHGSQGP